MTEEQYCNHECPKCGLIYDHVIDEPLLPKCKNKDYFMNCGMCIIRTEIDR